MGITRRNFVKNASIGAAVLSVGKLSLAQGNEKKPNIIWLMAEDIGPDLSCYGIKGVQTPTLDKLAAEGARYTNAFCTCPVCSPSRSAMSTGMHQNAIGAHQHRTANKKPLPDGIKPITHYLRDAGYYTALGCGYSSKTDLNYKHENLFDGKDWKNKKEGQPFYAQITFANTHRSWGRDKLNPIDEKNVEIPPYYPDTKYVRRDWANGLEEIQIMDRLVGKVLKRLEAEGEAENTVIFFIGDNGRCHIRGKQFLYEGGIYVPLIAHWPGKIKPKQVIDDMVMTIDVSAAILAIAGVKLPDYLQGQNFLDPKTPKRKYIYAARGKMDDTHDCMRTVRSKDHKYILNLMPERAWCQYNRYKEASYPVLALMNVMNMKGELNEVQANFLKPTKPKEEFYDLNKDPHELNNLAKDPKYKSKLEEFRKEMVKFRESINDQGPTEEFRKGGWKADYPTKTEAEWSEIVKIWDNHLFNGGPRPKKDQKKKKKKK